MSSHSCRHSAITTVVEKTDGNVRKAEKLSRYAKLNKLQIDDDNRNRDQLEMFELLMDGLNLTVYQTKQLCKKKIIPIE